MLLAIVVNVLLIVEESSPMKRGLKRVSALGGSLGGSVEESSPMKRGLKLVAHPGDVRLGGS